MVEFINSTPGGSFKLTVILSLSGKETEQLTVGEWTGYEEKGRERFWMEKAEKILNKRLIFLSVCVF
jgi:hypothetical protein